MSTELAQCAKCAALLNDADEDIAKHRRWHTQQEDAAEAVRRVASAASTDVRTLTGTVKDYQRPTQAPQPAAVSIRVTDPDELEPDDTDHIIDVNLGDAERPSFDLDSITPEDRADADAANAAYNADDYPLAIDRDDDLDTRIANATGAQPTI